MDFYVVLDQIVDLLRQRGRVSYAALKRQFGIDEAYLEDLKIELIEVQELATDRDGKMLLWSGETARVSESTPASSIGEPVSAVSTIHAELPLAYTPPYLAEKILTSRSALAGERKQVTVLFADIKGSTALIEDLDPEEAQRLLDPALHHMMQAVHRYEGTVNQVLGDGVMALFGAPIAHEDHAARACYAALAMQAAMQPYTDEVRRSQGLALQIRVGMHAGEVVVRSIGNDLHMDYSAVGQTTHLAARMEQLATPGRILMTAETLRLVDGLVRVEPLGPIAIKGLSAPVEVYELTGASSIRRRLQAAAVRGLTRFVGRDTEMVTLMQVVEHTRAGHGQVLAAVGEAGVGKSRLVYEFLYSHHVQGCLVLESASVSYGKATPYLPIIELLKRYVQATDEDTPRTLRAKVTGHIVTLDEALQDIIPALLSLLDALPEDSPFLQLDPGQRRRRTLEALKRLLLRESQVQPLLLVFEDLHWIDAETQALLDSLVESVPTARLLLLVNYRPEYQHAWGSKTYYTQIRLDPLPPASAEVLLAALLGDDASLEALKKLLIARTEGNPFFLEESVRTLVETATFVGTPVAYRLAHDLPTIQVPPTVQAVLAARIDRLPAAEKRLLQTAAVIGTEVPLPLLRALDELPEDTRRQGLTHLQAAEFLYETSLFPEHVYTFKHALTHEVAYGSLLQEQRRVLHARVVEALEALAGERVAEQVEHLAHHALRGEAWDKALAYCRQAGEKAMARSAHREAVASFEQALTALAHLPETRETREQAIDVRIDLRHALAPLGDYKRMLAYLREAETLATTLDDSRRLAQLLTSLSLHCCTGGEYDQAIDVASRAVELAMTSGAFVQQADAHQYLGRAHYHQGNYRQTIDCCKQAMAALDGMPPHERFGMPFLPLVHSYCWLAWCYAELGMFAKGSVLGEEGLRIAEAVAHPASLMVACHGLSVLALRQGDLPRARPLLERIARIGQDTGLLGLSTLMAEPLGAVYTLGGHVADALPLLTQTLAQLLAMPRVDFQARCALSLGEAHMRAGHLEDAHTLAERALAHTHAYKERGNEAWTMRLLGDIASHRDPPAAAQAAAHYQQALALAEELGMRPLQAHCHYGLGLLYSQTTRSEQARAELHTAIELYRDMAMAFWLPQAEAALTQAT